LGMQCMVIEFARNVLKMKDANSTEFDQYTDYPVIDLMENQKHIIEKGGTMRLGGFKCELKENTLAYSIYEKEETRERHRHRYEFNNKFLNDFEEHGMIASGINPDTNLVEIVEIPDNKWFVGVQFHPEYRSTVVNPHPVFINFVKSIINNK